MSTAVANQRIALQMSGISARLMLTNPPLNVIDLQMMDELLAALEQSEQRSDITAIVISGSARAFSAGVDIGAHTPDKVEGMLRKFHSVIRALVARSVVSFNSIAFRKSASLRPSTGTGFVVKTILPRCA